MIIGKPDPSHDSEGKIITFDPWGRPRCLSSDGKRLDIVYPNPYAWFVSTVEHYRDITLENLTLITNSYFRGSEPWKQRHEGQIVERQHSELSPMELLSYCMEAPWLFPKEEAKALAQAMWTPDLTL